MTRRNPSPPLTRAEKKAAAEAKAKRMARKLLPKRPVPRSPMTTWPEETVAMLATRLAEEARRTRVKAPTAPTTRELVAAGTIVKKNGVTLLTVAHLTPTGTAVTQLLTSPMLAMPRRKRMATSILTLARLPQGRKMLDLLLATEPKLTPPGPNWTRMTKGE